MTLKSARILRGLLHFLLGIVFVILATGGGRLSKIDFFSLDAWILVALLPAFALARAGEPLLYPAVARVRDRIADRPLAFVGLICALLAAAHLAKFLTLHVHVLDAGFLYQAIFHGLGSPFLKCDVCHGGTFLGAHASPSLAFLTPFAMLFRNPLGIPFLQAGLGFVCFAALAYAFRTTVTRRRIAFAFFVLLAVRGIRESFIFDLREDLVGAFFFIVAYCILQRGRPLLALLPFACAAFAKETAAILLPFAMVAGLYAQGKPRRGMLALYVGFSLALSAISFFWLLPHFTPGAGSGSDLAKRLAYLGATPAEIFLNLGAHPFRSAGAILSHLVTAERLKYLLITAGPIALLAYRAFNPYYIAGSVLLAGNLLSEAATQRMMQFHYEILLLPFFGFGLLETLRRAERYGRFPRSFFTLSLLIALAVSGTWPMTHLRTYLRDSDRIADVRWGMDQVATLAPNAVVLGDALTVPLLTARENLRLLNPEAGAPADAHYALLQAANGKSGLNSDWEMLGCGPREILCGYRRR